MRYFRSNHCAWTSIQILTDAPAKNRYVFCAVWLLKVRVLLWHLRNPRAWVFQTLQDLQQMHDKIRPPLRLGQQWHRRHELLELHLDARNAFRKPGDANVCGCKGFNHKEKARLSLIQKFKCSLFNQLGNLWNYINNALLPPQLPLNSQTQRGHDHIWIH